MSDIDPTETLRAAERRLQAAQLASDVRALSELLDDAVLFTGQTATSTPRRTTSAPTAAAIRS